MSSGAYSWHDFLEIWTSWSFVWFLFWVKALQRAFDICVAAVRVGEAFHFMCVSLHKMQTYCVIMHFSHLSWRSPFLYLKENSLQWPLPLVTLLLLFSLFCAQQDGTHQSLACLMYKTQQLLPPHHRSPLFLDFCDYSMILLQHIFTHPFTTLTYFVIESTRVFPIILLQSLAWENSQVKNKDKLKK